MKLSRTLRVSIALVMTAAAVTAAQAAPTTFFGNNPLANGGVVDGVTSGTDPKAQRDLFLSRLAPSETKTESFGMPPDATNLLTDLFGVGSGVSLSASGADETISRVQNNYNGAGNAWTGRFNTTGDPAALPANAESASGWFETNKSSIQIDFTTAVSAFGTFFTDVGDFRGALAVEISGANGQQLLQSVLIPAGARNSQGGLAFFGYTNDTTQFNRVLFTLTQPTNVQVGQYDFIGFDDFITGPLKTNGGTVPEPTSLALVGLSLALLGCSRRRKSKV